LISQARAIGVPATWRVRRPGQCHDAGAPADRGSPEGASVIARNTKMVAAAGPAVVPRVVFATACNILAPSQLIAWNRHDRRNDGPTLPLRGEGLAPQSLEHKG
jgi:hypothetical protein